jgi:uncharacterized metal-binding protein YceD (DUF177 family)
MVFAFYRMFAFVTTRNPGDRLRSCVDRNWGAYHSPQPFLGRIFVRFRVVPREAEPAMPEFALQVIDIDETGKDYSFELTQPWLEQALAEANLHADPELDPGLIEVHVQKNGIEYLVEGRVRANLMTECGRCLGVARVPVDTRFATLYARAVGGHGAGRHAAAHKHAVLKDGAGHTPIAEVDDALDEDEDEVVREEFSGHEIVLDNLIREYLVLETPMQPLCSNACTGIAVPAHVRPPEDVFGGGDSKVDPRLAPLLRLRDKVPPNKE